MPLNPTNAQDGVTIVETTKIALTGCVSSSRVEHLSRAQKLKRALKHCRTKYKHKKSKKRLACEKQARKKYGPIKHGEKKAAHKGAKSSSASPARRP